jgi:threonine dehydratase
VYVLPICSYGTALYIILNFDSGSQERVELRVGGGGWASGVLTVYVLFFQTIGWLSAAI